MAGEMQNSTVVSDQVVLNTIQHLNGYVTTMIGIKTKVDDLTSEIGVAYKAQSAQAFIRKIQEWIAGYDTIMQKYQALVEATEGAQKFLTQAEEEAHQVGGNWGGSIYDVLSG